ncbi:SDR family NAD(P)-dependent oxidoreductase [Pseudomonas syringae]|uniref:SDR family NAD(P)-dependent oxidoreductase n=1 Tax=Pseudomonas syringae TaxID=317 RepID=UPI002364D2CA|nr:SDR family oxidoreductase [Pseudomonas syringae]GKQ48973.1 SDR family oxidoreductase [Pseudomonas syringae pv. theae]
MKDIKAVAVITGAGSGIGAATAMRFARSGLVIAVCDINAASADDTAYQIRQQGGQATAFTVDVTDEEAVEAVFSLIESELGQVTYLVNNVGIEITGPSQAFSLTDYDSLFNVNVKSVFLCSRAAAHYMAPRGQGSIVNLASVASFKTWPLDGIYSATKAAVLGLTKAFAVDLASTGVRVNAVAPAIVDTPMTDRAIAEESDREAGRARRNKLHPLGRMATPNDIAESIFFLSSAASSFTTGACLTLDNGLLA